MPDWNQDIRRRLAGLKLEPARESSIVEELAQYRDDHYEELLAGGAEPAKAEGETRAELNGSELPQGELRRGKRLAPQEPIALGTNQGLI